VKVIPALTAVLLAGLAAAQGPSAAISPTAWTQLGGGPGHAGVADGLAGTLDVLAAYSFVEPGEDLDNVFGNGVVVTPEGVAALAVAETETCTFVLISDVDTGATRRGAPAPCPEAGDPQDLEPQTEGTLVHAYVPLHDLVVETRLTKGDQPVFLGRSAASGEVVWTVTPLQIGVPDAARPPLPVDQWVLEDVVDMWIVDSVAVDPGRDRLVSAVSRLDGSHRIVSIWLANGTVAWESQVPSAAFLRPYVEALGAKPAAFLVAAATVTETGIVVEGVLLDGGRLVGAAAWLTHDGDVVGAWLADEAATTPAYSIFGSYWSAAQGETAAAVVGAELLFIDPLVVQPRAVSLGPIEPPASYAFFGFPGPAWWGEHLLVPLGRSVRSYDTSNPEPPRWTWTDPAGRNVAHVVISPPSDAYVLTSRRTTGGNETVLFRLDLTSDVPRVLQRLPLPTPAFSLNSPVGVLGARSNDAAYWGQLLPLGDGRMLVADERGWAILLGPTEPAKRPVVDVSNAYPAPGEGISVALQTASGEAPRALVLAWGDGAVDDVHVGEPAVHEYALAGLYTIRGTAIYPDNRTATSEAQVFVGGTPPPELNFMQRAFAPDRAETTWGIFGLVLTLAGATVALAERRRRRGKLGEEIRVLERVKEQVWRAFAVELEEEVILWS